MLPAARGAAVGAASWEADFITTCLNAAASICQISHLNRSEGEKGRGREERGEGNKTRTKPPIIPRGRRTKKAVHYFSDCCKRTRECFSSGLTSQLRALISPARLLTTQLTSQQACRVAGEPRVVPSRALFPSAATQGAPPLPCLVRWARQRG